MDKKFECFKKSLERIYINNKIYREKKDYLHITPDDIKSVMLFKYVLVSVCLQVV